jgi:hypothetical protein
MAACCFRKVACPWCNSGPKTTYVGRFVRDSSDSFTRYGPRALEVGALCDCAGGALGTPRFAEEPPTDAGACPYCPGSRGVIARGAETVEARSRDGGGGLLLTSAPFFWGYLLDYRERGVQRILLSGDGRVLVYANARPLYFVRAGDSTLYVELEFGKAQIYLSALPEGGIRDGFRALGLVNLSTM